MNKEIILFDVLSFDLKELNVLTKQCPQNYWRSIRVEGRVKGGGRN